MRARAGAEAADGAPVILSEAKDRDVQDEETLRSAQHDKRLVLGAGALTLDDLQRLHLRLGPRSQLALASIPAVTAG